jgi:thiamine biosynthesis lipoprotein
MLSRLLALLTGLLLLTCCSETSDPEAHSFSDIKMAIRYKVVIGETLSPEQKSVVRLTIDRVFQEVDSIYNQWNPSSEVSKINNTSANQPIEISTRMDRFLSAVDEAYQLTEGRYDPTVGSLVDCWKNALKKGFRPDEKTIQKASSNSGWHYCQRHDGVLIKQTSSLALNFDGMAKGYCVDRLMEELRKSGFANMYIEWGGEIRVSGIHPDNRPWKVMVAGIGGAANSGIEVVELHNSAIATSGDYYQQWSVLDPNGHTVIFTHIIDPATGEALQVSPGIVGSATVLAPTCALADALATACMLFPNAEQATEWASRVEKQIPGTQFWIIPRR